MKNISDKNSLKKFIGNSEGIEIVDLSKDEEGLKEIVKSYISDKRNKKNERQ